MKGVYFQCFGGPLDGEIVGDRGLAFVPRGAAGEDVDGECGVRRGSPSGVYE